MRGMLICAVALVSTVAAAQETPELKTQKDKLSYAMGIDLGRQLHKNTVEVDPAVFNQGLKDGLSASKALLTDEQIHTVLADLGAELKHREFLRRRGDLPNEAEVKLLAADNAIKGDRFQAANKKKDGVVVLPSGLQYKVLKAAEGRKPADDDTVVFQYRGTFIDGREFDSTYTSGKPVTRVVKSVLPGWKEGLKLMSVGSKYQLFIPPGLAYGAEGSGSAIGGNATLIFEVELLEIK